MQSVSWCRPTITRCNTHIRGVVLGKPRRKILDVRRKADTRRAKAYDTSKALIYYLTPNRTTKELSVAEYATAGFLSAVPTTLVTAPVERAKVLLQVSVPVTCSGRACTAQD